VIRNIPLGVQFDTVPGMDLRFMEISEETGNRVGNFIKGTLLGDLEGKSDVQIAVKPAN